MVVVGGLWVKYLQQSCCTRDCIKFDMQYDHVLRKLNLELLTPPQGSGGLGAKYWLPCFCMRDILLFLMQHDNVLKQMNFDAQVRIC